MKLANSIQKEQRKKENKRKREQFIQKTLQAVIGVPGSKIVNTYYEIQEKSWKKDEEKSKQKVLNELIGYIKKEMASDIDDTYYIYNAWRNDDIGYGLCLHYFPYETKHSKKMRTFKRIFMDQKGVSDLPYYNEFFRLLQNHFSAYEDIDVETGIEKHWGREYEYIKLTLKTKKAS